MTLRLLSFISIFFIHSHLNAQRFMNLNFEFADEDNLLPKNWYIIGEKGCDFALDSHLKYSGQKSFLLAPQKSVPVCSALILNELQQDLFKNKKRIKINAWIRSQKTGDTNITIVAKQLSVAGNEIIKPVTQSQSELPDQPWRKLHAEQEIDSETEFMAFGLKVSVQGPLWIDKFEIFIDDIPLKDNNPPAMYAPSADDITWLNKNAIPIKTVEPTDNFEDLLFLQKELANFRMVALGEITHGSSEIYKLKHRLLRFLFTNMGYKLLAMEMNMAEARPLNNYVVNNEGDPEKLLLQVSYWPWQTEEFLQLLKWMNAYNKTHAEKIQIAGFDLSISALEADSQDRDQRMADNVNSIIKKNPSSKMILWAHNAHISKTGQAMGEFIKQQQPFFSIGFGLGNGKFNATSETTNNIIGPNLLSIPPHDSYEYYFLAYKSPVCYLNLVNIANKKTNAWLLADHPFRYVGSKVSRYQFGNTTLTNDFDAILFIQNSTPSHLLIQH